MPSSTVEVVSTRKGLDQVIRRWPATDAWGDVLIVHGLGEHSGRYERTGSLLAEHGLDTVALDLTGFGGSGGRQGYVASLDDWLDDIADRLSEMSPRQPRFLLGHSMGGLVVVSYLLSHRVPPRAAVLSAPALDSTIAWWKKAAARVLDRVRPTLALPNDITGDQLSRDRRVGDAYFADPLVQRKTTAHLGAVLLSAIGDALGRLDELDTPTLVLHGSEDTLVPTDASKPLAGCRGVERRVLANLRHEIFNEPEGPEVIDDVVAWLRGHTEL